MSRAKVFTFGDLDFLSVWISLVRKGTKGQQEGRSRLWGGVSVGRVGKFCSFFVIALGKKIVFPMPYLRYKS